jgi:DNA-binding GntR family transcriptional regulator
MTPTDITLPPIHILPDASAAAQVYAHLRAAILTGQLAPDTRLSEQALCAQIKISRQPVREALLRLASEGLVVTFPQRGSVVTRIDPVGVRSAQIIREGVEIEILRRLVALGRSADLSVAAKELDLQKALVVHADREGFQSSDERFHASLAAAAGLSDFWLHLEGVKLHLDRVRYRCLRDQAKMAQLLSEHAAVMSALASGQADLAETTLRLHLRRVIGDVEGLGHEMPALLVAG